jgi:ribosomal protein S18 acetylase RimI-like enzyme
VTDGLVARDAGAAEVEAFLAEARQEYARQIAEAGDADVDRARAKADVDLAELLPGTFLWRLSNDGGPVGWLYLGERVDDGEPCLWVYDVVVDEPSRGLGYGRAAMTLVVDEARRRGLGAVRLNVWGGNDIAFGLYESMGFVTTSRHMRLPVTPER